MGRKNTNRSQHSGAATEHQTEEPRPAGLDWKQESLCQAGERAPTHVTVWARHVTFLSVSKTIFHLSLDGETTTPHSAIITSKTKPLLLPNYLKDAVLRLTALESYRNNPLYQSYHHYHHHLVFPTLCRVGFRERSS